MTKAQPKKKTTQFVLVTPELQINNEQVLKAYTKIVEVGIDLLKGFEMQKYRTYILMEHTKNEQNVNLIKEFVCHFYNITLSNSKEGKSYIFIDLDDDFIKKFGNNLANRLLRQAYQITQSDDNSAGIEYSLRPNFLLNEVSAYLYKLSYGGDTNVLTILVADKEEVA